MTNIQAKIDSGAAIIDVRSPEEFAEGSFPGAINIPINTFADRIEEIPRDVPVVLYCKSGARSGFAEMILKAQGFGDVTNAGGLEDMPN